MKVKEKVPFYFYVLGARSKVSIGKGWAEREEGKGEAREGHRQYQSASHRVKAYSVLEIISVFHTFPRKHALYTCTYTWAYVVCVCALRL